MTAYVADGTTIARQNDNSPQTYDDIPQVTSIGGFGQNRGLIDITNLSSSAREYKKAIKDGQELQLVIQYDPDNAIHNGLRTDNDSENARNFRVSLPDSPATVVTFAGLVTNWTVDNVEIDNVLTLNVTIKPTGDLTFS